MIIMNSYDKVIDFFQQICAIPHASYDEGKIGDWLVDFAAKRGLEYRRDDIGNVVIKKPATVSGCSAPAVIIQGHMDMVYVRSSDCKYTYEQGIKPIISNGFIFADGTTLGADDGLALAYALAVLDSGDIAHPDLEAVFTVQEEVGLGGAEALDCADLKAKYLINIDSEQEGIFYTSCAGAVRNDMSFNIEREKVYGKRKLTLRIHDLKGGHSGMEIHYGRPNAIMIMLRTLLGLGGMVRIYSIDCDGKTNAIATGCDAVVYVDKTDTVLKKLDKLVCDFNLEFEGIDKINFAVEVGETEDQLCWSRASHAAILGALLMLPNGVISMSPDIEGLVETSANPGILKQENDKITVSSCIRSSVAARKNFIINRLQAVADMSLGDCSFHGDYPQWEYDPDSKLRELAMDCYRELFGKEAAASAIHAGLECGYFAQKMPGIDMISLGPDQYGVHTTREKADIASIGRVWELLLLMLEKLSK